MTALATGDVALGHDLWSIARGFATGVSVVTAGVGAEVHGCTVSAFSVISRQPPLATISVRRGGLLLALIRQHAEFVINVLAAGQERLAGHFASRRRAMGLAQFTGVSLADAGTPPVLDGSVCWLRCRTAGHLAAGDHELVLGEVLAFAPGPGGAPLLSVAGVLHSTQNLLKEAPA